MRAIAARSPTSVQRHALLRRDAHFAAQVAAGVDHLLQQRHLALRPADRSSRSAARIGREHDRFARLAGERRDLLPQLLGDERESPDGPGAGSASSTRTSVRRVPRCCAVVARLQLHLRELQVPVAVLVPDEAGRSRWRRCRSGTRRSLCPTSASVRCSWLTIQRSTSRASTGAASSWPQSLPSEFISTKRVAFQSLLQKLR